jgi:uncharacterized protein YeaO (DUF488 family)
MTVAIKRVYAQPSPDDGTRVLVDRLWPRGLTKTDAALDAWLKDIAPSTELRKWFHAHPVQWSKFREKYLQELSGDAGQTALKVLYALKKERQRLTLLFAAKDRERNHALILKQLVEGERKPPTGTGPLGAAAGKRARA